MSRERVLGALRSAPGAGSPPVLDPWAFPALEESDPVARFVAEAALVDAEVVEAVDGAWWEALRPFVSDQDAVFPGPGVAGERSGKRVVGAEEAAARPEGVVGVVWGHCGIAESGTVVVDSEGAHLPSLLTDVSVLLLAKDRIVVGLESLAPPGPEVRNRVLVTGPSRTADIEKKLVLGAHGPRRLVVVLV